MVLVLLIRRVVKREMVDIYKLILLMTTKGMCVPLVVVERKEGSHIPDVKQ